MLFILCVICSVVRYTLYYTFSTHLWYTIYLYTLLMYIYTLPVYATGLACRADYTGEIEEGESRYCAREVINGNGMYAT